MDYSIGELARKTATKVQTVRYYEEIGLLPAPPRSGGNQRRYDVATLRRLAFIRHARELGFSLDSIRNLLDLNSTPGRSCEEADRIARVHLAEVVSRIERLQAMKEELQRMIDMCSGGTVADCRVIDTLADHRLCAHSHH